MAASRPIDPPLTSNVRPGLQLCCGLCALDVFCRPTVAEPLLFLRHWPLYWTEEHRGEFAVQSSRRFAVPSETEPLSKAELAAFEAKRALAAELLQSVREMKASQVFVVSSPVIEARKKTGLSQSQLAVLLGASFRTLQGREQGRKQPSGGARTLLAIASTNPEAVLAVASR